MANYVFIFGAGASAPAGAPLMNNFIDLAEDVFKRGDGRQPEAFETVFNAIAGLQSAAAKGNIDLDNLESLYGAFEMCELLKKLPGNSRFPGKLTNSLSRVIETMLERTVYYPTKIPTDTKRVPAEYKRFRNLATKLLAEGSSVSIITFNYDLCLEQVLWSMEYEPEYHLEAKYASNTCFLRRLSLLKLHGSLNWHTDGKSVHIARFAECLQCGRIDSNRPDLVHIESSRSVFGFQDNSKAVPFIVPPTLSKGKMHEKIRSVWQAASSVLEMAEHIVFVGYSLPESDQFFNALFAIGSAGPSRIRRVLVIDKDTSGKTRDRYSKLLASGIQHKFEYCDLGFENGMKHFFPV